MTYPPTSRLAPGEFIALMGMLFATIAFSIDAMLPALPDIAGELSPDRQTLAQLVVTSFVLGMGLGTLITGPLSDAFGRRAVMLGGAGLYILGSLLAYLSPSLETLFLARMLQGLGAAGPRVVSMAIVRDLYSGREMARIISFAMLVFTLFPAVAPLIGSAIIWGFGWRAIFLSFLIFALISIGWFLLRQPETLPVEARRPLAGKTILAGIRESLAHRQMQLSILVQTLIFGVLFANISSIQQVTDLTYGMGAWFPWLFGAIAVLAAPAAPINGRLVRSLGMRPLIRRALWVQSSISLLVLIVLLSGIAASFEFWIYFGWSVSVFALMGFTMGNLNALALEPLGHIAGLAASIMGALATIGGAILGGMIGQLYSGTATPLVICSLIIASSAAWIMRSMPREAP